MIALAAGFFPAQHMLITSMQLTWYLRREPWSFLCSRLLIKSFLERFLRVRDLQFSDWGVGYRIFPLKFVRVGASSSSKSYRSRYDSITSKAGRYKVYLLFEKWEGLLLVNSLNVSSLSSLFDCEW